MEPPRRADQAEEANLAEMVREAERVIDHQVRAQAHLDEKSQRLITLTVAALAGGLAVGSLVTAQRSAPADAWFVGLYGFAGALNIASMFLLVDAYAGPRQGAHLHVGPSVSWLVQASLATEWSPAEHLRALLVAFARFEEHNRVVMDRGAARHHSALRCLMVAVTAYALGFLYVLGRLV